MQKLAHLLLFLAYATILSGQDSAHLKVVTFEELKPMLSGDSDTIYVLNFWATWCAPCVKELPYFERLTEETAETNVRVMLVSLDFKNQIESKLLPFLRDRNIQSSVFYLDAPNPNEWIDLVDPSWSGALPATLVYRKGERKFYEQSFEDYEELETIVQSFYKI